MGRQIERGRESALLTIFDELAHRDRDSPRRTSGASRTPRCSSSYATRYEDAISPLVLASDPSRQSGKAAERGRRDADRRGGDAAAALIHLLAQDTSPGSAYTHRGDTPRHVPSAPAAGALSANVVIELFRDLVLRMRDQTPA